jgi:hypothetical protein
MCSASSACRCALDALLDQSGVDAQLVLRVVQGLVDAHPQGVAGLGMPHQSRPPDTPRPASAGSGSASASTQGGDIQLSGL